MKMVLPATIMIFFAYVAISHIKKHTQLKTLADDYMKMSPAILISAMLVLAADMIASVNNLSLYTLASNLMPSALAMWLLTSSFSENRVVRWVIKAMILLNLAYMVFHVCRIFRLFAVLPENCAVMSVSLFAAIGVILLVAVLSAGLGNTKTVMRNGSVWAYFSLSVDIVYLCFIVTSAILMQLSLPLAGDLMLAGAMAAMGIRSRDDSEFVICRRQEKRIVESMRTSSACSSADLSHNYEVYKELYDRIVSYFEMRKPYLDGDLNVTALAKDLYSNKLYVSRAISQFTGKNFCQFVNYYRVTYSMDRFRENPELKVHELATLSGFNSIVSYNMAFRLIMGENPSEWCRKEKSILIKKK